MDSKKPHIVLIAVVAFSGRVMTACRMKIESSRNSLRSMERCPLEVKVNVSVDRNSLIMFSVGEIERDTDSYKDVDTFYMYVVV